MLLFQNYEIITFLFFYFVSKFLSYLAPMFHDKRINKLTSIPEKNENEDVEKTGGMWVPKKKHDVLKAKYKCLKKLFQIYDGIGILPQAVVDDPECTVDETPRRIRKKRPHNRTRTDACTSVVNACAGDAKVLKDSENNTEERLLSDKIVSPRSVTSIQVETIARSLLKFTTKQDDKCIQDSDEDIPQKSSSAPETEIKPSVSIKAPASCHNLAEKRKSRFQNYVQRLLGLKSDSRHECRRSSHECQRCCKSDNNICTCTKRRRRRALKVTSPRRSRLAASEVNLRDLDVLSYVQAVQNQFLMDKTPRQCPMTNCQMITYGIINYNDHLNFCHFPERKYICHYCHEGFMENKDKLMHENEHIGITKLLANFSKTPQVEHIISSDKKVSVTQTDPGISEEKLLKIMTLIEKIPDPDALIERVKTIEKPKQEKICKKYDEYYDSGSCGKKTSSWPNFSGTARGTKGLSKSASERSPRTSTKSNFSCKMCGEAFGNKRYLQFHVDVDHRDRDLTPRKQSLKFVSKDGNICIKENTLSDLSAVPSTSTFNDFRKKDSVSYDPSTNIIYFTSLESIDEGTDKNSINKMHDSTCYKWESGTKIIRV